MTNCRLERSASTIHEASRCAHDGSVQPGMDTDIHMSKARARIRRSSCRCKSRAEAEEGARADAESDLFVSAVVPPETGGGRSGARAHANARSARSNRSSMDAAEGLREERQGGRGRPKARSTRTTRDEEKVICLSLGIAALQLRWHVTAATREQGVGPPQDAGLQRKQSSPLLRRQMARNLIKSTKPSTFRDRGAPRNGINSTQVSHMTLYGIML